MPKRQRIRWSEVSAVLLCVNGLIFLFYGALVPAYVRSVHWLITLAAALFLAAIPGIYHSMRRVGSVQSRMVTLLGFGMAVIVISDLLFTASLISGLSHDVAYATGNALFLLFVLVAGFASLKGAFGKWLGYLSLLTVAVGFASYTYLLPKPISSASILLIGVWSLALGLSMHRTQGEKKGRSRLSRTQRS